MENVQPRSKRSPEELFNKFSEAQDCGQILHAFQRLVNLLGIKAESPREFYHSLKSNLQSWKCKSLWELLDNRANHKDYDRGKTCEGLQVLVIGAGPIGLRTAIELALLGAQVVVVEKRQCFARNNVLHLWPFLLDDFRSLGAKRFYGKFCSGAINHISIRRLQSVLLKTALIFGVKVFTGVTFDKVLEPANEDEGWKCHVTPDNHPINEYEIDVVIGADGKKNVLPGFAQIEMRGSLAIGITANFVNHYTEDEAKVEEISGIAYQFNPAFFDKLYQQKGIKLENIVYYKDETHYFVMTAGKASLLKRGVLKQDLGNSAQLLAPDNIEQEELIKYVVDTVHYATKGQLNSFEFKMMDKGQPDVAAFDFTSIKKAESSARIKERKGSKLLIGLVGDSLLEPFWPTGSGCARGVLSALDAAWMVRSFAQDKPPLQILSERENIYRLLSGTSNENLNKNCAAYSINPCTRYTHIPHRKLEEVYHLYDTDDPVNADYSLGSPLSYLGNRSTKKRTISTAAKPTMGKNRNRVRFSTQLSVEKQYSAPSSCSSMEDLTSPRKSKPTRTQSEDLTSGGEEISEMSKRGKKSKKSKKTRASPLSPEDGQEGRSSKSKGRRFMSRKQKVTKSSPIPEPGGEVEKHSRKRSFFGFGRGHKSKSKGGRKSPRVKEEVIKEDNNLQTVQESAVAESEMVMEGAGRKWSTSSNTDRNELVPFKRDSLRRSTRDIIAEMEARDAKVTQGTTAPTTNRKRPMRKSLTTGNLRKSMEALNSGAVERPSIKRATSDVDIRTPPPKQSRQETLWDEIACLSPRTSKQAVPVLSQMSPEADKTDITTHNNVSAVVRMAGMLVMATPLLIDERRPGDIGRIAKMTSCGQVRNTISKFNNMNDYTPSLKNQRDSVRPRTLNMEDESVDAPGGPTKGEASQENGAIQRPEEHPQAVGDWQPTALAFVDGKTQPTILDLAKTRRKQLAKQESIETCQRLLDISKRFALLDEETTDSPAHAHKELNPKIYQKTFLTSLQANNTDEKTNDTSDTHQNETKTTKEKPTNARSTPKSKVRESPTFGSPEVRHMKKLMENLTETLSKERAHASLRFLINIFRRIQKNPKDDKFRRIFKSRVKFKKFVWTVRNAKLFMFASGWQEVGSFLVFPLTKSVGEPLNVLTKYLGSLDDSPSLLKPVGQMRSGRGSSTGTPLTTKTNVATPQRKNGSTTASVTSPSTNTTPLRKTQEKKRLTRPINNSPLGTMNRLNRLLSTPKSAKVDDNPDDITWDLEMEDPLGEASYTKNVTGRQSATSSDMSDVNFLKNMRLTPIGISPLLPVSPDPAIMEEIDGLSNTLDDLILSLDDLDTTDIDKENNAQMANGDPSASLYTTLDYMLESEEDEAFTPEVGAWKSEPHILQEYSPNEPHPSAFIRVSSLRSAKEILEFQAKMKQPVNPLLKKATIGSEPSQDDSEEIRQRRRSASDRGSRLWQGNVIDTRDLTANLLSEKEINGKTAAVNDSAIKDWEQSHSSTKSSTQMSRKKNTPSSSARSSSNAMTSSPVASSKTVRSSKKETSLKIKRGPSSASTDSRDDGGRSKKDSVRRKLPAMPANESREPIKKGETKQSTRSRTTRKTTSEKKSSEGDQKTKEKQSRPPSGRGSQRQNAQKKQNDIASKLDGLESGFESLANSPLSKAENERAASRASRTSKRTTSISSIDSNASSKVSVASSRNREGASSRTQSRTGSIQSSVDGSECEEKKRTRKGSASSVSSNTRSKTKTSSGPTLSRTNSIKGRGSQSSDEKNVKDRRGIASKESGRGQRDVNVTQRRKGKKASGGKHDRRDESGNGDSDVNAVASVNDSFDSITVVKRQDMSLNDTLTKRVPAPEFPDTTHENNSKEEFASGSWRNLSSGLAASEGTDAEVSSGSLSSVNTCNGDIKTDLRGTEINGEISPVVVDSLVDSGYHSQLGKGDDSYNTSDEGHHIAAVSKDDALAVVNTRNRTYPIPTVEERLHNVLEAANGSANKKKTKPASERRSILRIRSRSEENLVWGKKKNFEPQNEPRGRSATIDTASTKKRRGFPFHLRKKGSGSCSDISIPEESELSLQKYAENLQNNLDNGVVTSQGNIGNDNTNLSVSPSKGKSPSKKKISPFRRLHIKSK